MQLVKIQCFVIKFLLIMNAVIIKCILLCVFSMKKTDRNNILNTYSAIVNMCK